VSNRSLVELNHDYCPPLNNVALLAWAHAMRTYIGSGDQADLPDGVTFVDRRHHSVPMPTVADLAGRRVTRLAAVIALLLAEGRVAGIDGFQRVGRQVWTRAERIAATIVADEQENAA